MSFDSDIHEVKELPEAHMTSDTPAEPQPTRRRVRINSAAEVRTRSASGNRLDDVEAHRASADATDAEVEDLIRAHRHGESISEALPPTIPEDDEDYAYSGSNNGLFYHLLQAYHNPVVDTPAAPPSGVTTPTAPSPSVTPPPEPASQPSSTGNASPTHRKKKWYDQEKEKRSQETLGTLIGASAALANPQKTPAPQRPHHKRTTSSTIIAKIRKATEDRDVKIRQHVATILRRQQYIIKLCRALMLFGAPTHRLEEYLAMCAKVLEINSQFLYIPGCMIMSFDDPLTHTAEIRIVRVAQGVNLGKLKDTHEIYKEVLHDCIDLDQALARLDEVLNAKDRHSVWLCVLMYGLASTAVSCFFKARPIDFPIIFVLGCLLGFLQLVVAPLSRTYSTVFEISAAILMTFLARAFGSIRNGEMFCFSALTQSAIAMILPGWLVLSSSLELQSKAIVPGSIRLVFAIIYSLFLGYGITVGTAIYGALDANATNDTQCRNTMDPYWNFLMVPLYVFFTCFVVQAKYKQMPAMVTIAFVGYVVNYFASQKFSASAPIAYTFGAFAVGVLANLYSRLRHGVAAAVLLPAVYVQVPGSLASSGSINTALQTASSLIKGLNDTTTANASQDSINAISFNVAASMIQIAIGITVGLFMSCLLVYPLGKKRSGLWTL